MYRDFPGGVAPTTVAGLSNDSIATPEMSRHFIASDGRAWRELRFDPRTVLLIHYGLSVGDAGALLSKAEALPAAMATAAL